MRIPATALIDTPNDVGVSCHPDISARSAPVRIHGKFFIRGDRRLRIHGVTYGPFAPQPDGMPFPQLERVRLDFASMTSIGINAIRTYNVPPQWLLHEADAQEIAVLV